ncbi:uncharacterized protein LOC105703308 isoform X2 [Orussus abietinus]|uniref:uncharacterized protein LOC105703308 isoform X2 n=1 Tax=Orussus abietinus TaxID=222816 RepID=UPI0006263145|nr:uncharacterized protein LOC105703308 isoform X2 [Orussus abietinus]
MITNFLNNKTRLQSTMTTWKYRAYELCGSKWCPCGYGGLGGFGGLGGGLGSLHFGGLDGLGGLSALGVLKAALSSPSYAPPSYAPPSYAPVYAPPPQITISPPESVALAAPATYDSPSLSAFNPVQLPLSSSICDLCNSYPPKRYLGFYFGRKALYR